MKNKYYICSRISEQKIRDVVRCIAVDLTAIQTSQLTGLNRNTINRIYQGLRERIYVACEAQRPMFGIVEVDENLFGPHRVKGKRGRGLLARHQFSVYLNATGKLTLKLCQTAQKLRCKALSGER